MTKPEMLSSEKLVCGYWRCGWAGTDPLTAPDPFTEGATLYACPKCKEVNQLKVCCDEPGCDQPATCGTPVANRGYRRTCGNHQPEGVPWTR